MFQLDLTSNGELNMILPGGRRLEIPATVGGLEYVKKVLQDHHRGLRNQLGYIGTLPTQHAVDKHFADEFLRKKKEKAKREAQTAVANKSKSLGIDFDKLRIDL